MWHCPHCGAPQAESARCWVCRRSSTTCSTCRHFRTSLAAEVGYCGRDRGRAPLTGLELRPCWEEARLRATVGGGSGAEVADHVPAPDVPRRRQAVAFRGGGGPLDRPDPMRLRGFVPLDELAGPPLRVSADVAAPDSGDRDLAGRLDPEDRRGPSEGRDGPHEAVPPAILGDVPDWASQTSLFGDSEG